MSRSFLFILLIIFFNSTSISHAKNKSATSILLFGDSIIAGYGLAKFQTVGYQLEKMMKEEGYSVKVINGGVSGDTTAGGRNRIKWTLEEHNPHIIFIALGGNDLLRGIPVKVVRNNIDSMLKTATKSGSFVILSEVEAPLNYGRAYQNAFNDIFPEMSEKHKVPLHPFLLKNTMKGKGLMQSDGIHPSELGAKRIAATLAEYFIENIKKKDDE